MLSISDIDLATISILALNAVSDKTAILHNTVSETAQLASMGKEQNIWGCSPPPVEVQRDPRGRSENRVSWLTSVTRILGSGIWGGGFVDPSQAREFAGKVGYAQERLEHLTPRVEVCLFFAPAYTGSVRVNR